MQRNADPNIADRSTGMTPLMWTAAYGRVDLLELLLGTKRCNLECKTRDTGAVGETAIILAAEAGHWLCVEQLLHHGASPLVTNQDGVRLVDLVTNEELLERFELKPSDDLVSLIKASIVETVMTHMAFLFS